MPEENQAQEQPAKKSRAPLSHKLYDRMGLKMSLKAINIFIAVVVAALVIAIIVGILT